MGTQQPLFRGSIMVNEEINGYYTVRTTIRFEHKDEGTTDTYRHLSWNEAVDLMDSVTATWNTARRLHETLILLPPWNQGSLFDDLEAVPTNPD